MFCLANIIIEFFGYIREHPFNLKGGGELCFFRKKIVLSANFIEKKFLSVKWAEKNILLALCALKNIVFVEKNNVAKKKNTAALPSEKKYFDSEKTP